MNAKQQQTQSRRNFLQTASLTALALPLMEASAQATPAPPLPVQIFRADALEASKAKLKSAPGNDNLYRVASSPISIVLTTEEKKKGAEFEWHEGRDHVFQILEGSTSYELGGTPANARNSKPMEWLALTSEGARTLTLNKGDMLVIPRGTPHRRTTADSVTFYLISTEATAKG